MGHCKDCKFWESHLSWRIPDSDGTCKQPNAMWRTFSLDEEGLDTKPEFGCVQFEAKG